MQISEVRVKLINNPTDRLKAFCSITLDGEFVVRDIKLIEGGGGIFVAMPSRKLSDHCPRCHAKNHLRARYCNECAGPLGKDRVQRDDAGRRKLHADIAHPINSECRQSLQERIVAAFEQEVIASKEPGYSPTVLDDGDDFEAEENGFESTPDRETVSNPPADDVDDVAFDAQDDDDLDDLDDGAFDAPEVVGGGGYQEMIADLKRDAAQRRTARETRRGPVFEEKAKEPAEAFSASRESSQESSHGSSRESSRGTGVKPPFDDDSDFGAGLDEPEPPPRKTAKIAKSAPARPTPPAPKPTPKAEPVEAAGGGCEREADDDGFGAGIF